MALWTKRHSFADSIAFEAKIWCVCESRNLDDENFQTRVFVFNPESKVFTETICIYPEAWQARLHTLTADEQNLYMWRSSMGYPGQEYFLYQLNRETMKWEHILTIYRTGHWTSVVIINEVMYISERDDQLDDLSLITIDLSKRKVVEITLLTPLFSPWDGFLSVHNKNLYLMEFYHGSQTVSEIKNGNRIEIAREEVEFNHKDLIPVDCSDEFVYYLYEDRKFEVTAFDFESLTWTSEVTNPVWQGEGVTQLQAALKINSSFYMLLLKNEEEEEQRFEIHELDLHPKLTSICLADLTNRFSKETNSQKIEGVKEQLPSQLRGKLSELLKWRLEVAEAHDG